MRRLSRIVQLGGYRLVAAVLAVLILGACLRAQHSTPPASFIALQQARAFVDSLRLAQSLPGMAATVVHRGSVIWSETKFRVGSVSKLFASARLEGFGLADRERGIPATPPCIHARS